MYLYMIVMLIISLVLTIFTNILTRVGADYSTNIYDNFPNKFTMTNKNLLKLYIVYPKSLVTKSSFLLYITQILIFITLLIINSIYWIGLIQLSLENIKLMIYIFGIITFGGYLISFGFDFIISLLYRQKNKLSWNDFYKKFTKNKEDFSFAYKKEIILVCFIKDGDKESVGCNRMKGHKYINTEIYQTPEELLDKATFDGKKLEEIFPKLKLMK